jgi:hypothetical protein
MLRIYSDPTFRKGKVRSTNHRVAALVRRLIYLPPKTSSMAVEETRSDDDGGKCGTKRMDTTSIKYQLKGEDLPAIITCFAIVSFRFCGVDTRRSSCFGRRSFAS